MQLQGGGENIVSTLVRCIFVSPVAWSVSNTVYILIHLHEKGFNYKIVGVC